GPARRIVVGLRERTGSEPPRLRAVRVHHPELAAVDPGDQPPVRRPGRLGAAGADLADLTPVAPVRVRRVDAAAVAVAADRREHSVPSVRGPRRRAAVPGPDQTL